MGNWKQHLTIGVVIELLLILFLYFKFDFFKLNFVTYIIVLLIALISPLLMDLDHRNGKLREILLIVSLNIGNIGIILWAINKEISVLLILGMGMTSLIFFIPYKFKHRNELHSIVFCLLYGTALFLIFKNLELGILGSVGAYSHLLVDKIPFKIL